MLPLCSSRVCVALALNAFFFGVKRAVCAAAKSGVGGRACTATWKDETWVFASAQRGFLPNV